MLASQRRSALGKFKLGRIYQTILSGKNKVSITSSYVRPGQDGAGRFGQVRFYTGV